MRTRRVVVVAVACALLATGCAAGGEERTVLVDYSHDEFPSFVASNFPKQVQVHPGTNLVFKQTWTGEPHSVTGGTLVNDLLEAVRPYMEKLERGGQIPDEPPKDVMELEEHVAWSIPRDEVGFEFNQTGAQPCYLARGEPRKDGKPCEEQSQPVFTGKQTFYNSGIIPYEGPSGNEFNVQLADDIAPGSYWFFCNFHGEFQSTEVVVKPRSESAPSAEQVNRDALEQVRDETGGFEEIVNDARDGRVSFPAPSPDGDESITIEGNFAGLFDPKFDHWHSINEFIPNTLRARAGEDITWNVLGLHTISFGVPKYFPVMTFDEDGTVKRNKRLDPPAGGARKFDVPDDERDESRTEPLRFDAGEWDGRGFWSSGTIDAHPFIEYTIRITEPGTYRFACLIHPPMVGTLEVT